LHFDERTDPVSPEAARRFAENWVAAWNRRDLDDILAKYRDDARFVSPKAAQFAGNAVVEGKASLRRYWETALSKIGALHFTLDQVVNDPDGSRIVVIYVADLDGRRARAAETFALDSDGRIAAGEALYGAVLP
jgi:ketosteroid isomerase-like protein